MKIINYDVICVGSGVAGMMACLAASHSGANVCLVSKEALGWGNTRISGGIISTLGSKKEDLITDILKSGHELNQHELVKTLINDSADVHSLVQSWGHLFDIQQGQLKKITPAGHSEARTLISVQRGIHLSNILRNQLLKLQIDILEEIIVCKVLVQQRRAVGILLYDWKEGDWLVLLSPKVILACGGGGMLYSPHTDNMRSATGDGYALGLIAGAELIDMEQIQFMPFGVVYPNGMMGLELGDTSAAGPYGVLKNGHGKVICSDLPKKTREEVSKIIALEIKRGNASPHGGIWLDPTENLKHEGGLESWRNWKAIGSLEPLKIAYGTKAYQWQEPFEVLPTQHYIMGGILIDDKGNTNVSGLIAAGETAGGVHGGGRMGSMSLFDGLVFGRLVGKELAKSQERYSKPSRGWLEEEKENFKTFVTKQKRVFSPLKLKQDLGKVIWTYAGIIRDKNGLEIGLNLINEIEEKANNLQISWEPRYFQLIVEAIELRFMLITARSILLSALARNESRGSHYREDFPSKEVNQTVKNIVIQLKQGEFITSKRENM
ncbi:FAD-binding protein [Bacillus sp. EB106-08-02-XG196]|uniref:FAD-binding protein n=1 Tax=Bacillus sp. EB106-08-02-XG196 TaxID=2737049 RepID=UPI0015C42889|nr:FAD-binding protein [Bacillus sp. EB106-08-02-XG196]NWQ43415.1 FAD-binding protein [Bacillus sp. EB106-08-02-XG196]